jgi:hypothetical protein
MARPIALAAAMLAVSTRALACDPTTINTTRQADVTCYGAVPHTGNDSAPGINAAVRAAIARRMPLVFPAGRYTVNSTVYIDYADVADTGIEVRANGAILDGGTQGGTVLYVYCSGGSQQSPKGCFYFHLSGTLHAYSQQANVWTVVIGAWGSEDAQNSIKIDHLDVNGENYGLLLNYVLNADMFVVSNVASGIALYLNQVQFSTIRGAAGASNSGWAMFMGWGYTFANTFQGLDLEVSDWCIVNLADTVSRNTFVSPYLNCRYGLYSVAGHDNLMINPLFGGNIQWQGYWPAGFKIQ